MTPLIVREPDPFGSGSFCRPNASLFLAIEPAATDATAERVIRAAYDSVRDLGIAKTTIEEIAQRAGVSRPTVYKYFAGKEAILDEISLREVREVNTRVRASLVRHADFADFLVDLLVLVIRSAVSNPFIRRMTESHEFQVRSMRASSKMFALQCEWWSGLLGNAAERGDVASDVDLDEVITWLTHMQSLLLAYVEDPATTDANLRRMIARFIVEPLLADPGRVRKRQTQSGIG